VPFGILVPRLLRTDLRLIENSSISGKQSAAAKRIPSQSVDGESDMMEFHFEVDPEFDIAIGSELSFDEAEGEFEIESFEGVDPLIPTPAKPGSDDKVRMLAARYAAGVPLWHDEDCYDHGPADAAFANHPSFVGAEEEEDDL
jgi:hypothetical protein